MNNLQGSLFKIQFGIFFNHLINRPDLISSFILNQYSNIFDASPINLGFPDNAPIPLDLPISQLRSSNNLWHLNVSKIRSDIIFMPKEDQDDSIIAETRKKMQEIILICANKAREQFININRITNITMYVLRPENSIEFLQNKLNIKKFIHTKELYFRVNQEENQYQFKINNITNIETGIEGKNQKKDVLILTKDVNTVVEENNFSNDDIKKFFDITNNLTSWNSIIKIFE